MKTHIFYIPGLGDGYDSARTYAVNRWQQKNVTAELVPMRWRDSQETYEQKVKRIRDKIDSSSADNIVLVGESAGGSMVVAETLRTDSKVAKGITICGKNVRSDRVAPSIYRNNVAFEASMRQADKMVQAHPARGNKLTLFHSRHDPVIRYVDMFVPGATVRYLPTAGHLFSILAVLFFLKRRVLKVATSEI